MNFRTPLSTEYILPYNNEICEITPPLYYLKLRLRKALGGKSIEICLTFTSFFFFFKVPFPLRLSVLDRADSHISGQCVLLCTPTASTKLSFNKFKLLNCTLFKQETHKSLPRPRVPKGRKCRVFCRCCFGRGPFSCSLQTPDFYLSQISTPSSLPSALSCLLPLYKGCFLNNNPRSIICHFHQAPALCGYTFCSVDHL